MVRPSPVRAVLPVDHRRVHRARPLGGPGGPPDGRGHVADRPRRGGTDAYAAYEAGGRLPSGETRAGLIGRMRDVVAARTALFPETLHEDRSALSLSSELAGDLDVDDDDRLSSRDSVEKSIDELLKGLGSDGDDDESFSFDDFRDDDEKGEGGAGEEGRGDGGGGRRGDRRGPGRAAGLAGETRDEPARVVGQGRAGAVRRECFRDRLIPWRKACAPRQFVERYVAAVSPESDGSSVDKEATRAALLSERPNDVARTKEFWDKIQTETEAESFLQDYRSRAEARLSELDGGAPDDEGLRDELEAVLSVPYDRQLAKLTATGALRPILDEYVPSDERRDFLARHSAVLLEGLELEHLVPEPRRTRGRRRPRSGAEGGAGRGVDARGGGGGDGVPVLLLGGGAAVPDRDDRVRERPVRDGPRRGGEEDVQAVERAQVEQGEVRGVVLPEGISGPGGGREEEDRRALVSSTKLAMIAGIAHLKDKQKSLLREIDSENAVKGRLEAEMSESPCVFVVAARLDAAAEQNLHSFTADETRDFKGKSCETG
ncbi:hypothetical protein THAOC_19309 [Thalassiosira oceanica]|uniref:Uncharacterized protein n=1 Tax=Thalassiosira oceanica TaxID=159749 RepID=K0S513_THAOC|nr:hypothetical protein THAOC_19309 [Thalassiosira oceanica]|eukprot:EJK60350.1 hypothetical protein THAOC_19309 [Thalassiosira oceanica]